MTTLPICEMVRNVGTLRRTIVSGNEVELTYHRKPYARVIAHEQIEQERAEMAALRSEVEELRARLSKKAVRA